MNEKRYNFVFYCCILATGGVFLMRMLLEILYGLPSFDGAMNLQVPYSLLKIGKWMTTYDGGMMFDNKIQTRGPVLFPIFLLWKIFGVHIELAIFVNVCYVFLLLFAVWRICKNLVFRKEYSFCLLVFIVMTPFFEEYAFGIYGEIPTAALFVLSAVILIENEKLDNRERGYGYSGVLYSLACLNKTVILIAMPAFIFIFLIKLLWDKSINIKHIAVWIGAYIIPILFFEAFHLFQMRGIWAYIDTWKVELLDIVQQAGVVKRYEDTPNIFEKFWTHINIFCEDFNFRFGPVVFFFLLCAIFIFWLYRFFIKKEHGYYNIMVLVMFSYFGWWTIISTTHMAWPRRILIGVILLKIVAFEDFYYIIGDIIHNVILKIMLACFTVFFLISIGGNCTNIDKESRKEIESFCNIIKEISIQEDATFYGFGWWQAPVISFFSEVSFADIDKETELPVNAYLLVDRYAKNLAQEQLNDLLQLYHTDVVEIFGDNYLYRITSLTEEDLFLFTSAFENGNYAEVLSCYNASDEYEYIEGVHEFEVDNDSRWASSNVEILLNKNVDDVVLALDITVTNLENMTNEQPILYIMINNHIVRKEYLYGEGKREILVKLPEEELSEGVKDIRLFMNGKIINSNGDARELAYFLNSIKFKKNA